MERYVSVILFNREIELESLGPYIKYLIKREYPY